MNNEVKVITKFNSDTIIQEVDFGDDSIVGRVATRVIELQDEGVRKALIEIGWTPPPEKKP